jgi:hypothetical protein
LGRIRTFIGFAARDSERISVRVAVDGDTHGNLPDTYI